MFLDPADPRGIRPPMRDERSTHTTYLRDQRLTLQIKCAGLDAEGMATRSVPPSTLSVADAWAAWRAECAFTDAFAADAPDLGVVGVDPSSMHSTLRHVLVHLIEEYARHNGHADLLRELIDGRIGQ